MVNLVSSDMTLDCIAEANRAIGRGDTIYALDLYELAASRMSDLEPLLAKYVKILRSRFVAEDADPVVDIIVPVFNAPQYARKCIESIASAWRSLPCRITVINDGSDEETSSMLRGMQANISMLRVIENKVNIGYTASVNVGLSLSSSKYVIVLNSDTIVSDGWIDRLVRCAESSPNIGVVGPLSNAASWQSVPDLYDTSGMFAVNELPKGMHVEEMARLVRVVSKRCYPLVPIVNGFCYLIKQEVIQCVGILDESNFPVGYGEENDFCIRTLESGYNIAVADDVYILHAKSKSFGAERKKELSKYGREALNRKHGEQKVLELVSQLKTNVILREMRELIGTYLEERRSVGLVMSRPHVSTSFGGISVLFVLPCKGHGGGIHSVIQEAIGLRNLGIHVRVAILDKHLRMYIANYASIDDIEKLLLPFNQENLHVKCSGFDVVIATIYNSVRMVRDIIDRNPHSLPAYYIQDYEPWFSPEGSTEYAEALESYDLIPGIVAFAKTDWLANIVNSRHGIKVRRVEASLDHTVYKPRTSDNSGGGPCVISAMIRPKTPRRGAARTMQFLRHLFHARPDDVMIEIFGCEGELDQLKNDLPIDFAYINHGVLVREGVAKILARSTFFVDLSDYQAFGRTGLEAMACGCIPMLPQQGGANEYAVHKRNSLIVDTSDWISAAEMLLSVLEHKEMIASMKIEALYAASKYSVGRASASLLKLLHHQYLRIQNRD